MNVVYNAKSIEKARKKARRREKRSEAIRNVRTFVETHREDLAIFVPLGLSAVGFLVKGTKTIRSNRKLKKAQDLRDLYCYDRSLGHYWKLRRKLSNAEWTEIDKRKNRGERLSDILNDMKVLK